MNNSEFSDAFDIMLNSHSAPAIYGEPSSRQFITLDEYEKSLFLTKAQEELVVNLYAGRTPFGAAFEGTEELRRYLSNLIKEARKKPIENTNGNILGADSNSKFFTLPEDLWFITYESVTIGNEKCKGKNIMKVVPMRQDEYQNIKDNPFRGANDRRALRLDLSEGNIEIICKYQVTDYFVRYIRKASPIILIDLPDNLTIEGKSKESKCELHEALHQKILEIAVGRALQSKGYNIGREKSDN